MESLDMEWFNTKELKTQTMSLPMVMASDCYPKMGSLLI